eukprot:g23506.t1
MSNDSISLISRSAPETDEDVERRIKRRKTRNDLELQEGQIEKLVGENKNIDKQIQSLEKKKAKNEQEIKALQKQVKKIKQAREDVDIAKGVKELTISLIEEITKYNSWINKGLHIRAGITRPDDMNDVLRTITSERKRLDEAILIVRRKIHNRQKQIQPMIAEQ